MTDMPSTPNADEIATLLPNRSNAQRRTSSAVHVSASGCTFVITSLMCSFMGVVPRPVPRALRMRGAPENQCSEFVAKWLRLGAPRLCLQFFAPSAQPRQQSGVLVPEVAQCAPVRQPWEFAIVVAE